MKKIYLLAAMALTLAFASCGTGQMKIDNPTDDLITVTVDGTTHEVGPFQLISVKGIGKGEHTITVNGGPEMKTNITAGDILLNPTRSTYVTVREEYGEGDMDTSDFIEVTIDGESFFGPFTAYVNELWIDMSKIDYDPVSELPLQITSSKTGDESRYKLFRVEDFYDYYLDYYWDEE